MASRAQIGEMRTLVRVYAVTTTIDDEGFTKRTETDIYGAPLWCKMTCEKASETFENRRNQLGTTATLTAWYAPEIDTRCVVYVEGEQGDATRAWRVIGVNNIVGSNKFMEISLVRGEAG